MCLGLQMAVIELARTVLGWTDAQSTEFDKNTTHPVVMGTHSTLEDKFKLYIQWSPSLRTPLKL